MARARLLQAPLETLSFTPAYQGVARLWDRAAFLVATLGSVWFAMVAMWGLFGPVLAGHYGTMTAFGIAAENMLRWKVWGPVAAYALQAPSPGEYYCHHPWGNFWITTVLVGVFG